MFLGNYLALKYGIIGAACPSVMRIYFGRTATFEIFAIRAQPTLILASLFHRIKIFINGPVKSISHLGPMGSAEQSAGIALIG